MDNSFAPAPSCGPLHTCLTQPLESDFLSVSYERICPYRRDLYGEAGLGLKFRLVEPLGAEGTPYSGDSFGDGHYIDTRDSRPCSDRCLCRCHGRTELHFVFLAKKTKKTLNLIIYDTTLYFRIAEVLGWDIVGSVFSQGGFRVDGFALLRNVEALVEDLQALVQQEQVNHQDAYLVSSMRLLVDGFLGDEEVFKSFGHTFLHEQQHISFDHWKEAQASQAVKDIELLDHGFHEAELDCPSRSFEDEVIIPTEHTASRRNAAEFGPSATPTVKASGKETKDQASITPSWTPKELLENLSEEKSSHVPEMRKNFSPYSSSGFHLDRLPWMFRPKRARGAFAARINQRRAELNDRQAKSNDWHKRFFVSNSFQEPHQKYNRSNFDPNPHIAASEMKRVIISAMEHDERFAGESLLDSYLENELYKSTYNTEDLVIEAARNRCDWILNSIMLRAPDYAHRDAAKLAYIAAQHSTHIPLQPVLQSLSLFEPEVLRLCIERAAKAEDNRSIRRLLSAAKDSEHMQHASIIWDAAMSGDTQILWSVFGPGARKTILTLLKEAGNIRMQQIHQEFTTQYPQLLAQLYLASSHPCTMGKWDSEEPLDSVSAWDRGSMALKLLVRGHIPGQSPDQFRDVMLVLSIASAMSHTLDSTGTGTTKWSDAFLRDLPRWQALLPHSLHQKYARCVLRLWGVQLNEIMPPELLSEGGLLDRFQSLAICLLRDTRDVLGLHENMSKDSLSSSQRRRAYLGLVDQTSEESPANFSPSHDAPTRFLRPWNDQIGGGIDPEPDEGADCSTRTREAIAQNIHFKIPSHQVPAILIMMGAIFFCLLQFTFFLRLCRTSLLTPVPLCTSSSRSSLLVKPLETLAEKCDFLELYLGLDERAMTNKGPLEHRLGLDITPYTQAPANRPDVSSNGIHVDHMQSSQHYTSREILSSSRSQSISESSPPDDEHGASPPSSFSATPNSESTGAAKSGNFCATCDVLFPTSSNFHRHMREKHKKARFACGRCKKDFSRADYVKKHKCRGKKLNARARAIKARAS